MILFKKLISYRSVYSFCKTFMISIKNISISVEDQQIIDWFSMAFKPWKNYCILWKNGSGKSSLALSLMGHPDYEVTEGSVSIDGEDLLDMDPDERAKAWVFLAFQSIPEIKWVKLFEFLRTIYNTKYEASESFVSFKKIIVPMIEDLGIDKDFLWRDLNVWFSWGERRKIEILQLKLLEPKYIMLDEVDSGLDVDAFKAVAELLQWVNTDENSFIIITHYFSILDYLPVDEVIVMKEWKIVKEWWQELADHVKEEGFKNL